MTIHQISNHLDQKLYLIYPKLISFFLSEDYDFDFLHKCTITENQEPDDLKSQFLKSTM